MADIQYFLGGNSPAGFYSLYGQLSDPDKIKRLYILKGGAGCGKSTLMKRVARHMQAADIHAEFFLCSADPDSLDAVRFPSLSTAIVDGTAPHVIEARYAGAVEQYIDLSRFYDHSALQARRADIIAQADEYHSHYKYAFRRLQAAGQLWLEIRESSAMEATRQKLEKRAAGIIRREIKTAQPDVGTHTTCFLTALTHRGPLALWESAAAQAQRIYRISDSYGLAHELLAPILTAAQDAGQQVVACHDPMAPDRLSHLLLPQLSLAFLTDTPLFPYDKRAYRHLRLDALAEQNLPAGLRPRLRFTQKLCISLAKDAAEGLSRAKLSHDKLEALYHPYVDFNGVNALADTLANELTANR